MATEKNPVAEQLDTSTNYEKLTREFYADVLQTLQQNSGEITSRNNRITEVDDYVYGDRIKQMLDIPIGHDVTPVNWLKRLVEIFKMQFMGKPFHIISTFDSVDIDSATDEKAKERLKVENGRRKVVAELRKSTAESIIDDNGGHAMFMQGAESASVAGSFIIKAYYDVDAGKYILSPVERVENCYTIWNSDNFRKYDAFIFAYQISKLSAAEKYGVPDSVQTSPMGQPLEIWTPPNTREAEDTEPMVTVLEMTGKLNGWASKNGRIVRVPLGQETELNALFIGDELQQLVDDEKAIPKYYIFPNKVERRRAWGVSDISDEAINIVITYIQTLSDWRTVANKVNFPKFKMFNFGPAATLPKFQPRTIQGLPLAEGQDLQQLQTGDGGAVDFKAQLEELKQQFVRETGVAQVLLDNSGLPLNSNQALITSMKPTSDIAEAKKQLWTPILVSMFKDAFNTLAAYDKETWGDLVDEETSWRLLVQWPSTTQKEDPVYQGMLLNRWNSRTISLQTFLEAQGESNEEIDRIRDEMSDELTAALHTNQLGAIFATTFLPQPTGDESPKPKVNINLTGDLSPEQEANIAYASGYNNGPFPPTAGPSGPSGRYAYANLDNKNFLSGKYPNQVPIVRAADGRQISQSAGSAPAHGQQATDANLMAGTQPVSQPGSGATPVTPQGAINQVNQNQGQ